MAKGILSSPSSTFNLLGWTRLPVPKAAWHPLNKLAGLNRASYSSHVWVFAPKPLT